LFGAFVILDVNFFDEFFVVRNSLVHSLIRRCVVANARKFMFFSRKILQKCLVVSQKGYNFAPQFGRRPDEISKTKFQ